LAVLAVLAFLNRWAGAEHPSDPPIGGVVLTKITLEVEQSFKIRGKSSPAGGARYVFVAK
jgi:hypothetical protein